MSYVYQEIRPKLFTEDGVRILLQVRETVSRLLPLAGAARAMEIWSGMTDDTWMLLAALDYLVELGDIIEITGEGIAAQHRIFIAGRM